MSLFPNSSDYYADARFTLSANWIIISAVLLIALYLGRFALATTDILSIPILYTPFLLIYIVPGALLLSLFKVNIDSVGEFVAFAIALSMSMVAILAVVGSSSFRMIGISRPLSLVPGTGLLIILISGLCGLVYHRQANLNVPVPDLSLREWFIVVAMSTMVPVAILAALLLNQYHYTLFMYILIAEISVLVVLLLVSDEVDGVYPFSLFSLSLTLLYHRSLLSKYVVGSDIQLNAFTAMLIRTSGFWSLEFGGSFISLPTITAVPALYAELAGISVHWSLKLVHPVVFALVPVAAYYLVRRFFSESTSFFSALLFLFFYRSFHYTPGKQTIAELFLILIILVFFHPWLTGIRGSSRGFPHPWQTKTENTNGKQRVLPQISIDNYDVFIVLGLLGIGLTYTHYSMFYISIIIFGLSATLLLVWNRLSERERARYVPIIYTVLLFVVGTSWYVHTSNTLSYKLIQLPGQVLGQVLQVLQGGQVWRSGAALASSQTLFLRQLNVFLYYGSTGLIVVGLLSELGYTLRALRNPDVYSTERAEFLVLAVPFLGLLGVSFFLSGMFGADRIYQIGLLFLAPFAAVACVRGRSLLSSAADIDVPVQPLLASLLVVFLLFNSGVVYTVLNEPISSDVPFDPDTHSLTYSESERAAAEWLREEAPAIRRAHIEPRLVRPIGSSAFDYEPEKTIYTDVYTAALFRSVIPTEYYNVTIPFLKYPWAPEVGSPRGYVYVRNKSIVSGGDSRAAPYSYLTPTEYRQLLFKLNKIYDNGGVEILKSNNIMESNNRVFNIYHRYD